MKNGIVQKDLKSKKLEKRLKEDIAFAAVALFFTGIIATLTIITIINSIEIDFFIILIVSIVPIILFIVVIKFIQQSLIEKLTVLKNQLLYETYAVGTKVHNKKGHYAIIRYYEIYTDNIFVIVQLSNKNSTVNKRIPIEEFKRDWKESKKR